MPIPVATLAALPWKQIGIGVAGALVLAVLAAPWILWRGAVKDRDVARAELVVVETERDTAIASALRAGENRERIELALESIGSATEALATNSAEAVALAGRTGIRARELASAHSEIAELRTAAAELRARTQNLDYCETLEIVIRDLAGGP